MKNYSFERVFGAENDEQVIIHRKNHGFRLGTKLLCLLLAFLFWLVVANIRQVDQGTNETDVPQSCSTASNEQTL